MWKHRYEVGMLEKVIHYNGWQKHSTVRIIWFYSVSIESHTLREVFEKNTSVWTCQNPKQHEKQVSLEHNKTKATTFFQNFMFKNYMNVAC